MKKASLHNKLYVVPGIELSCQINDEEVHLLGYFIDYKSQSLKEVTDKFKKTRKERAKKIVNKLNSLGINISFDEVKSIAYKGNIGRPHIAAALMKKGYIDNYEEAFEKYIGKNCFAYVEKYRLPVQEAIKIVHNIGGISVLAHPGLINNKNSVKDIIKAGIDGIEVYHSKHNNRHIKLYKEIALEHNLIITGGSDCHGHLIDNSPEIGNFGISYEEFIKIKKKVQE
ncbi:Putative metal-dependent phosphoesterases (PHP family) [Caldisalinibacter kiritimatiensis]|uniref:Putative metal-dependent phosphoesterases (PHP family) n=2 Tax=Caldisalinibacter kiritimatiensis TaxID=1304284 RepID=R1CEN8_9FIRM|nr:Putative metal-dependent phosphoesterases (PHP family) [Caldisalinibacter kiritimatiensis]